VQPLFFKHKNIVMLNKENKLSVSGTIILLLIFLNAFILKIAFIHGENWYRSLVITLPLLFVTVICRKRKKHRSLTYYKTKTKIRDEQNTKIEEQIYEQGINKIPPEDLQFSN
jgi:hypothetical protein